MGLLKNLFNQTRKPEGILGRMMIAGMNTGHTKLSDWGMSQLMDISPMEILDIGCGGGRNAGELLKKYPSSHLMAVDYSLLSVKKTREYNKDMIAKGRCDVQEGDVSALTLEAEKYDLVTAFETIYFWPGLKKCFGQVVRVLKPKGIFVICNESDGTDAASLKFEKIISGMKVHTVNEIETALTAVGFFEVSVVHHPSRPWITVIARKRP